MMLRTLLRGTALALVLTQPTLSQQQIFPNLINEPLLLPPFSPGNPLIGGPQGGITQGTRSGSTTVFPTVDATPVAGQCAVWDALGGQISVPCSPSGSGTVGAGVLNGIPVYTGSTSVSGATLGLAFNTAVLQSLPISGSAQILRQSFSNGADAPPLMYIDSESPCSIGSGAGDEGYEVRSADGKCWIALFPAGPIDAREYGVVCDGTTDVTNAVEGALQAGSMLGKTVMMPPGRCFFSSASGGATGTLTIPANTGLVGFYQGLPGSLANFQGSILEPTNTTTPFITMTGTGSMLDSLMFFYPNQVQPSAATPTVYPFTITTCQNCALETFSHLHAVNAYNFMQILGGRNIYEDSIVGAYSIGLQVDLAQDWVLVDKIMNQVMWDADLNLGYPQNIDTFVQQNAIAFQFERADSVKLSNSTAFSRAICLQFTDDLSINPPNSYGEATNIDCDTVGVGVDAHSTDLPGWRISNINIGLNASGRGAEGFFGFFLDTGGAEAPAVTVTGCVVRQIPSGGAQFSVSGSGQLYTPSWVSNVAGGPTAGTGCPTN